MENVVKLFYDILILPYQSTTIKLYLEAIKFLFSKKKTVKMLRVTIFVGIIWILIRIITIVLLLNGKSGNWSPIHGAGHIMALIQVNLF